MTNPKGYNILGIGAPIVDHIIRVDNDFIKTLEGGVGGMIVIDYDTYEQLRNKFGPEATLIAGGSCANTIKGLAHYGHKCAFFGKIGMDASGARFTESISSLSIVPLMLSTSIPTAQTLCLVTPDGERTMRTYLGASEKLMEEDLHPSMFEGVSLVHLEGYNLLKGNLMREAMVLAKEAGAIVSIDLSSYEIVKAFHAPLLELIATYVDILIANADEGWALMGLPPKECCEALRNLCKIGIVLFGEGGCWIGEGSRVIHGPAFPTKAIDTTGAGDLFTSGFLHGYLNGLQLEDCIELGNRTGSAVIEVLGAEIPPMGWSKLLHHSNEKKQAIKVSDWA